MTPVEPPTGDEPKAASPFKDAEQRGLKGFLHRHHDKLWWLHSFYALGLGVLIMFFAQKGYEQAKWLLATVLGLWFVIVLFYRIFGAAPTPPPKEAKVQARIGFFVMTYVMKNLYQGMLFFLLPFYWRSTTLGSPNQWFLISLSVLAVLATLDVVFDRYLMRYRVLSAAYFFITLFSAVNLALPAFAPALGPRASLVIASFLGLVGYLSLHLRAAALRVRDLRLKVLVLSALAVGLAVLASPVIPPVPYYILPRSGIGPSIVNGHALSASYDLIHESELRDLVALTSVLSPSHELEGFIHVWRRDGRVFRELTPGVGWHSSQPNAVFLTSHIARADLPSNPVGEWTVDVVTSDDRLVGSVLCTVFR